MESLLPVNWKELLKSRLVPSKYSISKNFDAGHKKNVKVSVDYDPATETTSFNVRISDKHTFSMFTGIRDDSVDCVVFGTKTLVCNLDPKFPACKGCPLNKQ